MICTSLCSCSASLTFRLFPLVVITMLSNFFEVVLPFSKMFLYFWLCPSRLSSTLLLAILFCLFLGGGTTLSVFLLLSRLLLSFRVSLLLLLLEWLSLFGILFSFYSIYTCDCKSGLVTNPLKHLCCFRNINNNNDKIKRKVITFPGSAKVKTRFLLVIN